MHPKLANLKNLMKSAEDAEEAVNARDLEDPELDGLLEKRDAAQEAVDEAVINILGQTPEWSNIYGYDEAFDECAEALPDAA